MAIRKTPTWAINPQGFAHLTSPGLGLTSIGTPTPVAAPAQRSGLLDLISDWSSEQRPARPTPISQPTPDPSPPPAPTPFIEDVTPRDDGGYDVTPRPVHSGTSPSGLLDLALPGTTHLDRGINRAIDTVTGLPFGIASTLINPRIVDTSWGTPFNTGGGGIIGAGGELSRRNLERVYDRALEEHAPTGETNPDYLQEAFGGGATPTYSEGGTNNFYAPGDIPGVTTPIAAHEGFIPGTRVVSGNTDLIPGLTGGQDGVIDATEVDAYAQERIRQEQQRQEAARIAEEQRQREAEIAAQLAEDQRLREAALAAERQRAAEAEAARQAELQRQEEARRAEQTRREREAAEAARAEAERQENIRRANEELARSNREREERNEAPQQGRAVTDRHGNPVRDSGGGIVTDRPTERDSDNGGGGGGGTWCCTAAYRHGMPVRKIKELRRWHREQSQLWQNGYDQWGYYIAEKLVKNSPFWASVTEAGHDLFVNKKVTPKSLLAWLVIVPGSYAAGLTQKIKEAHDARYTR